MKKKVFFLVVTIVASVFLTFGLIKIMPGDPVLKLTNELIISQSLSFEEAQRRAIEMLNYDPTLTIVEQFFWFTKGLFHGDLGTSLRFQAPVSQIIGTALPWTLFTAGTSMLLSFYFGTKLGLKVAWKKSDRLNGFIDVFASILGSIPDYIIGFLLLIIFSTNLGLFPARGAYSSAVNAGFNIPFILDALYHAILPITAMFLVYFASWVVNMRAVSANVMNEDYITYARARGLPEQTIIKKYVSKNSILPMITSLGISFSFLVGGAPLIENMFSYPGVGYYLGTAIGTRDYALMQGMFFVIIITVVLTNFFIEILYGFIDPRLGRRK